MTMEYVVQRLEIGDVVLIDLPEQGGEVEAKVMRAIDRTDRTVAFRCEWKGGRTSSRSGLSTRGSPLYAVLDREALSRA
jgi:hypothetical protein